MKRLPFLSKIASAVCFLSVAVIMSTSCRHHHDFVYDEGSDGTVKVQAVVKDDNGNTSNVPGGTMLGVYVTDEDGNVTFQPATVGEDGTVILPSPAAGESLIVYLPYQPSWSEDEIESPQIFAVQKDQSTKEGYEESDLMIGVLKPGDRQLTFTHMLAKVVVHIVDDTQLYDLSEYGMELTAMNDAVGVYLAEQSVATITDSVEDVMMWDYTLTDHRLSLTAIVAPQTVAAGTRFMKFISSQTSDLYDLPQDVELIGGKTCVITMRLTELGLRYDGTYIADWEDEGGESFDFDLSGNK